MLVWNVFYHDVNKKEITELNIFRHGSFKDAIRNLFSKELDRDKFEEEMHRIVRYYFWSKCEYEVIVCSWPPRISEGELERLYHEEKMYRCSPRLEVAEKVDIYSQLNLNWDVFVDFIWNHKGEFVNE